VPVPRGLLVVVALGLGLAAWVLWGSSTPSPESPSARARSGAGEDLSRNDANTREGGPRLVGVEAGARGGAAGDAAGGPQVLRGFVEDHTGVRRGDVEIVATADAGPSGAPSRTTSRPDGTFEVQVQRSGLHRVEAHHGEGAARVEMSGFFAAGATEHRLVLSKSLPTLLLEVVDAEGRPVPAFTAGIRGRVATFEGVLGQCRVGLTEPFADPPSPGSIYVVQVGNARDSAGQGLDLGAWEDEVVFTGEAPVRVVLPAQEALSGSVVDVSGNGVGGIPVTLTPLRGTPPRKEGEPEPDFDPVRDGVVARVKTDVHGNFRVARANAEARHLLEVRPPAMYLTPAGLRLHPDEAVEDIVLLPAVTARLKIEGPDGALAGAQVFARPMDEKDAQTSAWEVKATADGAGHVKLERLDPRKPYTLRVEPEFDLWSRRKRLAPLVLDDWQPDDARLRLAWARPLRGRVLDPEGQPVEGAVVKVHAPGFDVTQRISNVHGAFEWDEPPAGPLAVFASWGNHLDSNPPVGVEVAEAERDDFVVRLPIVAPRVLEVVIPSGVDLEWVTSTEPVVLLSRDGNWVRTDYYREDWLPEQPGEARTKRWRFLGLPPADQVRLLTHIPRVGYIDTELAAQGVTRGQLLPGTTYTLRLPPTAPADAMWWVGFRGPAPWRAIDHVHTQAKGHLLEIPGLPPGEWTVHVLSPEHEEAYGATVRPGAVADLTRTKSDNLDEWLAPER
jgi:hypothetical protein